MPVMGLQMLKKKKGVGEFHPLILGTKGKACLSLEADSWS